MAQAKRKSSGGKSRKGRVFVTLVLGVGIGVACVMLWQFAEKRWNAKDGIASLFRPSANKPADVKKTETEKKDETKTAKPKYDFYTILPETEKVLPDRSAKGATEKPLLDKPEPGASYVLQAGSFGNFHDADQLKAKLALNGLVAQIQKISIEGKGDYYRVRLGPYDKLEKLDAADQQLRAMGVKKPLRIEVKKSG
jgi:cell division protein FtsN